MDLPLLNIRNIKLSYYFSKKTPLKNYPKPGVYKKKVKNNFITITIYQTNKKNLINVTGVKHIDQIEDIQKRLEKIFNLKIEKYQIDNMFLSRKANLNFDIGKLIQQSKKVLGNDYHVHYDILLFRGIYLEPKKNPKPSFIIFRTGSSTVMSVKTLQEIKECDEILEKIFVNNNLRSTCIE